MVSIIVLAYNQLSYTKACLDSIFQYTSQIKTPFEVIVVDNGSTDGTAEFLQGLEKPGNIKVISNKENVGFPKANNQGAEIARGEYVCLLNNDTIVTSEWLEKLLRCIRSDSKLAAVGPYTSHSSGYQRVDNSGYKGIEELHKFATKFSGQEIEVDFLVFFCCLIKRQVWDELGGLDVDFGKGNFEDNLFCYRAIEKGYKLKVANCFIHHAGGQTFRPGKDKQKWADYLTLLGRNQKIFLKKIGKYKTISLVMIVGDFEPPETLKRCLDSVVDYVDEVCVVFNYKFFPKKRQLIKLTNILREYDYAWDKRLGWKLKGERDEHLKQGRIDTQYKYLKWTNFSDMRNKSIEMATGDYILWLDADDVMLTSQAMRDLIFRHPEADGFKCIVQSATERGTVEQLMHNRLFKNKPEYRFRNSVHEDITYSMNENKANTINTNITINHLGNVVLADVQRKNKRNREFLEKEIKTPEAHSLTYFHLINSLMLETGSVKKVYSNAVRAIKLIDEALERFKLTKEDPLTPKIWALRGFCCLSARQIEAAKQSFLKGWDEWKHPECAVNLAKIYNDEKKYDKTIEILDETYKIKEFKMANIPFDIRECETLMLYHLAEAWLMKYTDKKNDRPTEWIKKAEKYFVECISVDKWYLPAMDKLSYIYRQTGRVEESTMISVAAVNKFPHYFHGWGNLGAYEIQLKRYETAKLFLEKALKVKPDYIEAKHNLKMIMDMGSRK